MEAENSKLDLTSPNFDASLALSTDRIQLAVENVEPFDSITEYFKIIDKKPESAPQTSKQLTNQEIKEQRRQRLKAMTQHVEEQEIRPKSQRHLRNVVTYMENGNKIGPLGLLYKCLNEKIKIKVWTRNYKHIRGICTGFVKAYDKHWNLALSDVDESFVLYHKRKSPATGDEKISEKSTITPSIPQQNTICVGSTSKMQTCQRHVNQLFIRGENIVIISVCSPFANCASSSE